MQPSSNEFNPLTWAQIKQTYAFARHYENFFQIYTGSQTPQLYDLQQKALSMIDKGNKNLLVSSPTASGKTFLLYMAILKYFHKFYIPESKKIRSNFKAVYVAPTKAVCQQKLQQFKRYFQDQAIIGEKLKCVYISSDEKFTEKQKNKHQLIQQNQIIICTPEMLDYLSRFYEIEENLNLLLVDQVHLLDCEKRGYKLEIILNRMLELQRRLKESYKLRIVSVSASVPNLDQIKQWTQSELIVHKKRQVKLKYLQMPSNIMSYTKHYYPRVYQISKNAFKIIQQFEFRFQNDYQQSRFIPNSNRQKSENYLLFFNQTDKAQYACDCIRQNIQKGELTLNRDYDNVQMTTQIQNKINDVKNEKLKKCLKQRVAFHHAKLKPADKKAVIQLMKKKWVIIICSTTTLAMGVNLPVKAVIIMDVFRQVDEDELDDDEIEKVDYVVAKNKKNQNEYFRYYSNSEIDQMLGRAGRAKQDGVAYCTIVGCPAFVNDKYINKLKAYNNEGPVLQLSPIQSKFQKEMSQFLLFQLIKQGLFLNQQETISKLQQYIHNSLWFIQRNKNQQLARKFVKQLDKWKEIFEAYGLNSNNLRQLYHKGIKIQTYLTLFDKMKDWNQPVHDLWNGEKKFIELVCSMQQIYTQYQYRCRQDERDHFNDQIKVAYAWQTGKGNSKTERKLNSARNKAMFLVQALLKGERQALKHNEQIQRQSYQILFLFKQICKLIHNINFQNFQFPEYKRNLLVVFWSQTYIKYCSLQEQQLAQNLNFIQILSRWSSHLNYEQCCRSIENNFYQKYQRYGELVPQTINKQGFFAVRTFVLSDRPFTQSHRTITTRNNYRQCKKQLQKFIFKLEEEDKLTLQAQYGGPVRFCAFSKNGDNYNYKCLFDHRDITDLRSFGSQFAIIAHFPKIKGVDYIFKIKKQLDGKFRIDNQQDNQKNTTKKNKKNTKNEDDEAELKGSKPTKRIKRQKQMTMIQKKQSKQKPRQSKSKKSSMDIESD